jgi:uncharacterized protein YbjT (DUF2867 family)
MVPSILITDAAGDLGRALVAALTDEGMPVRVLAGPDETGPPVASAGVQIVGGTGGTGDALDRALDGIEHVVLLAAPAPNQVERLGGIVEAAERTGRPVHLVSILVMGAMPADAPVQLARWQAVTEAQIRGSGLPATTLRPQLLMQTLLRTAESIRTADMICGAFGAVRLPQIDARDVAAAAMTVLTTSGHDGQSYVLTGPQALSYPDVARIFSGELWRPIRYVDMPVEAYREYLMGTGTAPWRTDDLVALAGLFRTARVWPVTSTVTELTGRPARSLRSFVRAHAAAFRPGEAPLGSPSVGTTVCCASPL